MLDIYPVIRAWYFSADRAHFLESHRHRFKPDLVWNIEQGLKLSAAQIIRAERARSDLYHRAAAFFERFDLLLCPTVVAPPFDHRERYLKEVDGTAFDTYFDWLVLTFAVTLTACPSMSVPCGFTADGRPVGMQLVAPIGGERELLSAAAAFEALTHLDQSPPIDPRGEDV